MAHFYGLLSGSAKTTATRCGTKHSGLTVTAASWQGAVGVDLYEVDGVDYARVYLRQWSGGGVNRELYRGPVSGLAAPERRWCDECQQITTLTDGKCHGTDAAKDDALHEVLEERAQHEREGG